MDRAIGLLIRTGEKEITQRILDDLRSSHASQREFAAHVASLMYFVDEKVRTRLQELSRDDALKPNERAWFQWALEHAKSND